MTIIRRETAKGSKKHKKGRKLGDKMATPIKHNGYIVKEKLREIVDDAGTVRVRIEDLVDSPNSLVEVYKHIAKVLIRISAIERNANFVLTTYDSRHPKGE